MNTNDEEDQSTNSDDAEQGVNTGIATKIGGLIGKKVGNQAKKKRNPLGRIPKEDIYEYLRKLFAFLSLQKIIC
jgi:hypothetical protein